MTVKKMNVAVKSKKYCNKTIDIGIGNTFCQSIVTSIGNSF